MSRASGIFFAQHEEDSRSQEGVLGHKVARSGFFGQASKAGRLVLSAPNISTNYRFAKFKWTLLEHGPQGSHAFVLEDCLINLSVVPKKAGTTTVADCHRHNPVH